MERRGAFAGTRPGLVAGLLVLLLVLPGPAPLVAQRAIDLDRSASPGTDHRGCAIAASVLGGVTGALVGGAVGAMIERALYPDIPDAGITGLSVGVLLGAAGGLIVARKACDELSDHELRQRLTIPAPPAHPRRFHPPTIRRDGEAMVVSDEYELDVAIAHGNALIAIDDLWGAGRGGGGGDPAMLCED